MGYNGNLLEAHKKIVTLSADLTTARTEIDVLQAEIKQLKNPAADTYTRRDGSEVPSQQVVLELRAKIEQLHLRCQTLENLNNIKYRGVDDNIELRAEIEALRRERDAEQWIAVEERLPQEGQFVLVWGVNSTHPQIAVEVMYASGEFINHARLRLRVTHWCPLPEGPNNG